MRVCTATRRSTTRSTASSIDARTLTRMAVPRVERTIPQERAPLRMPLATLFRSLSRVTASPPGRPGTTRPSATTDPGETDAEEKFMNRTGRAVVYPAPNAPFEVREYPVRDARAGEVLVRISMSTICRSDIHSLRGPPPQPVPRHPGPRDHRGHRAVGRRRERGPARRPPRGRRPHHLDRVFRRRFVVLPRRARHAAEGAGGFASTATTTWTTTPTSSVASPITATSCPAPAS